LTPVFAAILAVLLLGEFPQSYHLVGLALIVLGIVLSNRTDPTINEKNSIRR
jgi:drug/metabolite transporter (DMT)-like permease